MQGHMIIKKNSIESVALGALLVRILFLLIVLIAGESGIATNIITDDIVYENGARAYLENANSLIDISAYRVGFLTHGKVFYPWCICLVAYFFRSVLAVRLLNILLSVLCCILIYKLLLFFVSEKSSLLGARLYAFLPYPLMMSCFVIKDVFLTFGFLFVLLSAEEIKQRGLRKKWKMVVISVALLFAMYNTRGGLVECLMIIEVSYFILFLYKKGKSILATILVMVALTISILYNSVVIEAFATKINDYSDYGRAASSIASLRIDTISQLWKLPFTYAFALIQPIMLSFGKGNTVWYKWLSGLNFSMIPIAVANILYLFICKKKYKFFYWSNLALYCGIIVLVLNVFRHYFFLLPISFINFALFADYLSEGECSRTKNLWLIVSIGVMLALFAFMLVN